MGKEYTIKEVQRDTKTITRLECLPHNASTSGQAYSGPDNEPSIVIRRGYNGITPLKTAIAEQLKPQVANKYLEVCTALLSGSLAALLFQILQAIKLPRLTSNCPCIAMCPIGREAFTLKQVLGVCALAGDIARVVFVASRKGSTTKASANCP